MRRKYHDWIKKYAKGDIVENRCEEFTVLMHATFPELVMMEGECVTRGTPTGHCWTEDSVTGETVDPAAFQFKGSVEYVGGTPWLQALDEDEEYFRLAVRVAEKLHGELLLPANVTVARTVSIVFTDWISHAIFLKNDNEVT